MSTSKLGKLLYKGFGIKNVIVKSINFFEKEVLVFTVHLKHSLKRCSNCYSKNVYWVFQMFSGVSIVRIWDQARQKSLEFISNLDKWKRKIISGFGFVTREIYGIP